MGDAEKIAAYLEKHNKWKQPLTEMRTILNATELSEAVKWGSPSYSLDKTILISIVGFKNHCALWFHQGVFLKDAKSVLVNAQEGTTKGMRQLRLHEGDKLNKSLLKVYVLETIANHRAGKKIAPAKKALNMPAELKVTLEKNKKLAAAFKALTPGKQREYADHISGAKQEKTRVARMEKAVPLILQGVGLNDKYKNC
tara:strand:+ start:1468 stop:2061 length:594 start_codon:yes stop_codon:yes gene_type:complete